MNILVTNDDGYFSEGIIALAKLLSENHNVIVVAPKTNMSSVSHGLSIFKNMDFAKQNCDCDFDCYTLTGTPADCVKFAMHYFKDIKFDLVCSGINKGSNLGGDVLYSGTVAGGLEGNFFGLKSIAFSNVSHGINKFDENCKYLSKIFEKLVDIADCSYTLNVNLPNIECNKIKGFKLARLGNQYYSDRYEKSVEGKFMLVGELCEKETPIDSDVYLTRNGYVSVTPILLDRTGYNVIEKLKDKILL